MIKTLLLCSLFGASLLAHGCKPASADNLGARNGNSSAQKATGTPTRANSASTKIEKPKADAQTANFKGVSFNYNPQIFVKVEPETIKEQPLQNAGDKPDSVYPAHTAFHLKYKTGERAATISVFPIADYRRMYAVSKGNMESFDENLKDLRKAIKDENFRVGDQVPVIPFYDASQTITARVKYLSFESGAGIFFLTQYNQDFANLVNNEELTYFYQGITADGKKYVLAEFPASAAFLPKNNQADEFEGYKLPVTADDFNEKNYNEYITKITQRLENLPADEFEPSLKAFEEIISSLKIER